MPTGSASNRFNDRGFTFISVDPEYNVAKDVFLHVSGLRDSEDAKRIVRGSRLEFEIVSVNRDGQDKLQARDVQIMARKDRVDTAKVVASGRRAAVKFWHPQGYGFIADETGEHEYYVRADSVPGGFLRPGDVVEFDIDSTGDEGRMQAVNVSVIGWEEIGEPFVDLLDMGNPKWAATLGGKNGGLAEPEDWNYRTHPAKDEYTILRSYIKYTFLRQNELPGHIVVTGDGGAMSFNTGLVTPFQEQIFAVFRRRPAGESGPRWILKGFEKASSITFLGLFGGSLPPLATYFSDPAQLVYDTDLRLSVNVEHVPHDQARFPDSLKLLTPQDLAAQVNAKAPEAVERVRRNYKTAIPQFYRDGRSGQGKMQLLLPVALLRRDHAELALAVDRLESGVYLGRTVLTLDWAYNNARLLTRPDTDWLNP